MSDIKTPYQQQLEVVRNVREFYLIWESRCDDLRNEEDYIDELKKHCFEEEETWICKEGFEGIEDNLKAEVRKLVALESHN